MTPEVRTITFFGRLGTIRLICPCLSGFESDYFVSKEDLLNACVEVKTIAFVEQIKPILEKTELSAVERLNRFMGLSAGWKAANIDLVIEVVKVLYRAENATLLQKMNQRTIELISPLLAAIIEQGEAEGSFDVAHPKDTAEMILHLSNIYREMNARALLDIRQNPSVVTTIKRRIDAYLEAVTRVLGAPVGAINIDYSDFLDALVQEDTRRAERGEKNNGIH